MEPWNMLPKYVQCKYFKLDFPDIAEDTVYASNTNLDMEKCDKLERFKVFIVQDLFSLKLLTGEN